MNPPGKHATRPGHHRPSYPPLCFYLLMCLTGIAGLGMLGWTLLAIGMPLTPARQLLTALLVIFSQISLFAALYFFDLAQLAKRRQAEHPAPPPDTAP